MLPSSKVLPTIYMCFVKPKIKITFVTEINTVFQYDLFTVCCFEGDECKEQKWSFYVRKQATSKLVSE